MSRAASIAHSRRLIAMIVSMAFGLAWTTAPSMAMLACPVEASITASPVHSCCGDEKSNDDDAPDNQPSHEARSDCSPQCAAVCCAVVALPSNVVTSMSSAELSVATLVFERSPHAAAPADPQIPPPRF